MTEEARIQECEGRRAQWSREREADDGRFRRIGNLRLLVAAIAAGMLYLVFVTSRLSPWWLAIPVTIFVALAVWQSRVARRRTLADRAIRHYERGLACLRDRWAGTGQHGERFRSTEHIYSEDLDVFGSGSLFELIANTRTSAGEEILAGWLLGPAPIDEASARQEAVRELTERLDLREQLALLGPDIQNEAHIHECEAWAAMPAVYFSPALRIAAPVLGAIGVVLLLAFFAQALPFAALAGIAAINITISAVLRKRAMVVLERAETAGHGLQVLAATLERFENEQFACAKLAELRRRLDVEGKPASERIQHLSKLMDWADSSDHILVRAIRPLVLWRELLAMGLERWRQQSGPYVAGWLRTIGELEALSSLAALAYTRPSWTFPEFASARGEYSAIELNHPLLPRQKAIANDVRFYPPTQIVILSGSNMSGKSTLLRAMGLNAVLAFAGAPVACGNLRISQLQTAASIRTADSLADNKSRFFAEILRLKQVLDRSRQEEVFFLLDEILSGTNSHDRRIGAAAVVEKLAENGAVGVVTTHDLALSKIELGLGAKAINLHFEDRIEDGRMTFDYKLKEGVVTHSNALQLMRSVGLEV